MQIPMIKEFDLSSDWKFYCYDHLVTSLSSENILKESVQKELDFWTKFETSFRTQVLLDGVNYLLSIHPETKTLRLASVRLFNEIFLLDQIESNKNSLKVEDTYGSFKKHVELISQVKAEDYPGITNIVTQKESLKPLDEIETDELKKISDDTTRKLLMNLNAYSPVLFEKFSDFALSLTANYALLRVHLLKFLAILPSLDHDEAGTEVKRILLEALKRLIKDSKRAKRMGLKGDERALPLVWMVLFYFGYLVFSILPAKILAATIRYKVRFMAKRFIAGETIELAEKSFNDLFSTGRDVTLDQLGELVVSEKEADHYMNEVLKLVRGFSLHIAKGEKNAAGILRAHVSIKVSALCSDFKPEAFDYTYNLVAPRLKKILLSGKENSVFINIDAEHYHYRDIVFKIYKKLLLETEELKDYDQTGIVVQAYLRDGAQHLRDVVDLAKERGLRMPIRLVKGAYWDAETVEAEAHGHDAPEFLNKEETDIHFRQMIYEIFKANPHIQLCIASHNFSDHAFAEALRETQFKEIPIIEHQCLHMTYEALSTAMAKMNWPVRNYVPIGSLIVGMAYLVRRIMENSSQVGVLTIMRSHKKNVKLLSPIEVFEKNKAEGKLSLDPSISKLDGRFINIPTLRSYLDEELETVVSSISEYKSVLGKEQNNIFKTNGELEVIKSPSDGETVVGSIRFANKDDALNAIKVVDQDFYNGQWSKMSWIERSVIMTKASDLMHARRNELSALIMKESGKAINEALADVDEAIDFINFYIREQKKVVEMGDYGPRGPVAVVAPWNFPLAIPCGMTVSSLIAGNTVILKSAEQTPLIANELVNLLIEAGVPETALIHLPGEGETVGQALIEHADISSIIFTGSKPVGVHIAKTAAKRLYKNKTTGKEYPVKVITEMGGKNAVLVTNNAELDETVSGILYSAFAHAGQKCSACSRVIVDNQIKDKLAKRLAEAARDIKVGSSDDFSVFINPLITAGEKKRLQDQVEQAIDEVNKYGGKVHIDRSKDDLPGHCVGPVILEVPKKRAFERDSFSQRELFAPVVHIIGVDGLDEGIRVFNSVEYGLTGGIFSQSQDDIDYCVSKMHVGNIYVNRPITGARVGIEPFGGFKMSGTGPKAGGVDYMRSLQVLSSESSADVKSVFENGSDYEVRLAKASGLPLVGRAERVVRALDAIINNFGPLFPGIFGNDKERLQSLRTWLINDFQVVVEKGRDNRIIPGQLNYSRFDSFKESCVYISLNEKPNIETFINFLMALACGVGITVLCTNQKSYIWWRYLIDILIKNRFSSRNIDCFFVSFDQISKIVDEDVDVVIVDGENEATMKVLGEFSKGIGNKVMTKFITPMEATPSKDHFDLMFTYTNERSYAVNVMRHGAPMELENL
jgi:RHH-type proline utilization regulon transcriptional repressor/proline dehydrogenase/delta 1-pyrroline-5-carboxylate dehydrogenase